MQGVNILNQTEIMECSDLHSWISIGSFICMICGFILVVIFSTLNLDKGLIISAVVDLVFVITLIVSLIIPPTEHTGRYKYEAYIEDWALVSDIYDNYEVIEQRGQLWILEDKEVK